MMHYILYEVLAYVFFEEFLLGLIFGKAVVSGPVPRDQCKESLFQVIMLLEALNHIF